MKNKTAIFRIKNQCSIANANNPIRVGKNQNLEAHSLLNPISQNCFPTNERGISGEATDLGHEIYLILLTKFHALTTS